MSNIFEALRADHDRQRELVSKLTDTRGEAGARPELFAELRRSLELHAAMEERHFYAPLMQHDATQDAARHGVAEHKELDDLVEALERYEMSGPKWIEVAEELEHRLEHHLAEEEREFFPVAGRVLTEEQKVGLAGAYEAGMAEMRSS